MGVRMNGGGGRIGVLIIDGSELIRAGVRAFLSAAPGIRVVGEARTAADGIAEATRLRPDVVLAEVRLPDGSGIDVCRALRERLPDVHVVMLDTQVSEPAVLAAVRAGASGYLSKHAQRGEIVRAVRAVASGQGLLDPAATGMLIEQVQGESKTAELAPQEARVLALVSEGKTNKEIAGQLGLSDKTVRNYLANAFEKLHVSRRAQAAALFVRSRIDASNGSGRAADGAAPAVWNGDGRLRPPLTAGPRARRDPAVDDAIRASRPAH